MLVPCPSCRSANPSDARFCSQCGAPLAAGCPACGHANPTGVRFCNGCGAPLAASREPRDYTPRHLAEKILATRSALEGERKQVTVLFADLKSSMELAEDLDPEDWHRILERFFQILADGVHRFEGTVNQYTGDGIMALFGAPIAHEDHAQRACWAALQLLGELRRYADELRRTRGLGFSVRMGMNSGEVVVGKIGDDLRMDYTAQGPVVGLAARVQQVAAPDRAYLTEHTAALVTGYFRLRDLGAFELKGVRESPRLHELEGTGPLKSRLDVSRSRGFSRFVGRASEMQVLDGALARALEGDGQVVGVVAEPGVGKSRLCFEFLERCRARDIRTYEAHGVAHGKAVPFLPVLELFRNYFGITDADAAAMAREKIAGRLLLIDERLREALPLLFDFLGVPDPERPAPPVEAAEHQELLQRVVRRVLETRGRQETTVTLLEDLHWFDGASESLLQPLVEARGGTRTLMLLNFRPEYRAGWMGKPFYQQLALRPLGSEAIDELLCDLLGTDPSLAVVAERIRERTAGNPFFIEESVRSLVESGHLAGERGARRLARPADEVPMPATVQAVLAARIDRLPEREKQLLQTAAVIGRELGEALLAEVAELPERELREALRALVEAGFLYESALFPESEYTFVHPLTREVAYASQLGPRRARIHSAVARALQAADPARLDERAALLAHHLEAAGEALEAARWHARAGLWAMRADYVEARRHWEKVRSLLAGVSDTPERRSLAVEACARLLHMGSRLGLVPDAAAALFEEGRAAADGARARALISMSYGRYHGLCLGDIQRALELTRDALSEAREAGDPGIEVAARLLIQAYLWILGRLRESLAAAAPVLEGSPEAAEAGAAAIGFSPYPLMQVFRAVVLALLGRPAEGLRDVERALELARARPSAELMIWCHGSAAEVESALGNPAAALAHLRAALAHPGSASIPALESALRSSLGAAHLAEGRWDDALEALERALALIRETSTGRFREPQVLARLAEAHLGRGELERARERAQEARDLARARLARVSEIEVELVLARVALRASGARAHDEVEAALARAEGLVEETEARGLAPWILEVRAELARALGDATAAEHHLREAHRLYTEMGASGHAARLAEELGLPGERR